MRTPSVPTGLGHAERKDLIFLLGLAAAALLWNLGSGSLASWDEANYAVVSRLIVRTGDWTVFRWPGGGLFFDKPPLYFWLTALFYKLLGVGEFATRLPSALGGIGLVGLTYLLGRRLFGSAAGLASAGVLLTATDFIRYARFGTMDVLQLFFFTGLILAYLGTDERPSRWYAFWLMSAGCFMTKGPLVVLAWGIVGIHFMFEKRWKALAHPSFVWGALCFIGIVAPWHLAAYRAEPEAFWREYVVKNYVTRGARALDGHEGNALFYLRVLINKYQPWIYLAPVGLVAAFRRLWRGGTRSADLLLLIWTAVVTGFFTFMVKTKLNWYILPVHPALSVLIGAVLAGILKGRVLAVRLAVLAAMSLHLVVGSGSVFSGEHAREVRQLGSVVRSRVPAYAPVYLYDHHEQPAALFYWDRQVLYADSMKELDGAMKGKENFWTAVPSRIYEPRAAEFAAKGLRVLARTEADKDQLYFLESK